MHAAGFETPNPKHEIRNRSKTQKQGHRIAMSITSIRFFSRILAASCLVLAGCQEPTPPATDEAAEQSETRETTETSTDSGSEVTVEVKSWTEVQQMVADHRGKVVVVDVWSTWCEPCMEEFPNLVKLHRQFPDSVACISVDIDYIGRKDEPPESFRNEVLAFVSEHQATFQNVISSDTDEDVLDALEVGSIPAVLVYDREGNLKKKFTNDENEYGDDGFKYQQHIIPLVEELLGDGTATP
jgi:thiol-disulfide isomerase/thioredoxin